MAEIGDTWITKYFEDRPQLPAPPKNALGFDIPFPWKCVVEKLLDERTDLRAKNEVLRNALQEIGALDYSHSATNCSAYRAREIAAQAVPKGERR